MKVRYYRLGPGVCVSQKLPDDRCLTRREGPFLDLGIMRHPAAVLRGADLLLVRGQLLLYGCQPSRDEFIAEGAIVCGEVETRRGRSQVEAMYSLDLGELESVFPFNGSGSLDSEISGLIRTSFVRLLEQRLHYEELVVKVQGRNKPRRGVVAELVLRALAEGFPLRVIEETTPVGDRRIAYPSVEAVADWW